MLYSLKDLIGLGDVKKMKKMLFLLSMKNLGGFFTLLVIA